MGIAWGQARLLCLLNKEKTWWDAIHSVCELGSQEPRAGELAGLFNGFGKLTLSGDYSAADLYRYLGVEEYVSIDFNGEHGAKPYDLNCNLRATYQFVRTFDLVTNFGTSEHCFNQFEVFRNIHELCRPGGIMLHTVPTQGWGRHCLVRYDANFFEDLASSNGYEMLHLQPFLRIKSLLGKDKSQTLGPMRAIMEFAERQIDAGSIAGEIPEEIQAALEKAAKGEATINMTMGCAMRKLGRQEFVTPVQGAYRK